MEQDNKQILLTANDAISRGDHDAFLRHCTEDTEWTFVGERVLRGKAEVRDYMRTAYLQPPRFDVAELIAEDNTVVAIGRITMLDGAGQSVKYRYCDVWHFRDGKLAALTAFVMEG